MAMKQSIQYFPIFNATARKGGDLTPDETTIIVGALELTEKTAKDAMTPISKAFTLDLDGTLNLWVYKLFNFIQDFTNFLFVIYVPGEKSELGHWILGVFDFTDWCIYVYDFNRSRRSDKVVQKVMLPYQTLISYFLKKVNFYIEKGIDKFENDTLPIKMVDEMPQQIQWYGALLWDHAKRKLEDGIKDNTTEKVGRLFGKKKRKRTHQEQ
ncbi:hypothetical protein T459_20211 [Capsicum annuum]|uniref:Ubiquitin-like protease family profile domain-containing protein n=1 Tax=Capsicum annuum TaxID=4072 RepID=A0A2G2Z3Y9_CAPAN|nr:hypothetical protein T459_20211 [Capsicum annuum]